jgi:hypothetical protein
MKFFRVSSELFLGAVGYAVKHFLMGADNGKIIAGKPFRFLELRHDFFGVGSRLQKLASAFNRAFGRNAFAGGCRVGHLTFFPFT